MDFSAAFWNCFWLCAGIVAGILFSLSALPLLIARRRRAVASFQMAPLRQDRWDDFCLLLVHVQPDRLSCSKSISRAFPKLPEHLEELTQLCRLKRIEVIHLRDGASVNSPWYPFWRRMNPTMEYRADPKQSEVFAKPHFDEALFVSQGCDAIGLDCGLEAYLQLRGRCAVLVAGVDTSHAVHANALALSLRGYDTYVVGDCCGDVSLKMHQGTLQRECRRSYAVATLEGVRTLLAKGPTFDLLSTKYVAMNTTQTDLRSGIDLV